ncbi:MULTISPECIES: ABC transporter substrate-binding protein [Myroides]|uniref:ABC transporter substrate-binding protein n=1 Tax=Myroides albus TaxID=2562892 RepID=A0A6I3LM88_9FLAO|nr:MULTISPECIES: helical backbone metal receptor [Myroides]MTG98420.1 ABC transporter substrate-binding protein [Myroides albus]MVX36836.1 ABC transporter substrate-binding protein [Myroides sp. LoEW2-1]UVD79667.1 helical backbone metal receptor [Myroides albus]
MIAMKDQVGQEHRFETLPKRIVSLVPSQTETLFDLGLEDEIVGITKFCVHPYHLKATKTKVGGTKKVHLEKIKLLQPDIIIANKEENTLEIVESLKGICPVWVTDVVTLDDNIQMIEDFGNLFNKRTEARKWIDKLNFAQRDFMDFVKDKNSYKAAYFIWREPFMVAGRDTFINELLKLNKFVNVYENREERYPEIELKKIRIQGDPEVVFLSSEPFPFTEEHAFEIGRFTHHGKTVFVDGEMFSWYGTHLYKAFDYFKQIHERLS